MLPVRLAVVDLETTGTDPTRDRVTEVAILLIDDGELVETWSSLVNPGVPIPSEIQALTGITDAMVRSAPRFAELADEVMSRLHDRVFVAHNARFDYGFIKNECRRLGLKYTADVLCTVRLSRRLHPEYSQHGLDAIVNRHGLPAEDRHRATGDARMAWLFLDMMSREYSDIDFHIKSLLRMPSLPPQLPQDALAALPEGPGVYVFFGVNDLPLYVGKSVQLRDRVRSHFSSDHMSANDSRLALEVRRIEFEETAGELGALIRESQWIKAATPLTNRALRRNDDAVFLRLREPGQAPERIRVTDVDWAAEPALVLYGPFSSRQRAKAVLEALAADHGLCWHLLALQRGSKAGQACFARQLRRCHGACVGAEAAEQHQQRLLPALDDYRFPPWPFSGPAVIEESHPERDWRAWHLVDRWQHLGVARQPEAVRMLPGRPVDATFDLDVFKLLKRHWERHPEAFLPMP